MTKYYLAIDIGASSGRHIIGYLDDNNELVTEELYRFKNGVDKVDNHLTWDVKRLFNEVKKGIKICLDKYKNITSMSIDTWGVDYILLDENDKEIEPIYAYRDDRTEEVIDKVHSIIPFSTLYKITGCQFQRFTTIYQLYKDKIDGRLDKAKTYLMLPEYLLYKLTGKKVHEYTDQSTTGLMDASTLDFSDEIISKLGFDKSLFTKCEKPGYEIGDFKEEIQKEVGGNIKCLLCATHDTGSAVEGIPFKDNSPYISSGTWSLLGIKVDKAIINNKALDANYSNEYGPNYIRFQKNIMGLWIIQNLAKEFNLDFITMVKEAKRSDYKELYDVNDKCFLSSLNMKDEIIAWFKNHNITPPKSNRDIINATYRSLAYSYKVAFDELEQITGKIYNNLYIVGGGAKNEYLNNLTEEFTKKKVIALPIEATAIGNLKIQMRGKGK